MKNRLDRDEARGRRINEEINVQSQQEMVESRTDAVAALREGGHS